MNKQTSKTIVLPLQESYWGQTKSQLKQSTGRGTNCTAQQPSTYRHTQQSVTQKTVPNSPHFNTYHAGLSTRVTSCGTKKEGPPYMLEARVSSREELKER